MAGGYVQVWLESVAANVARFRTRGRMTQAELAERADVDLHFIQRLERARANFSAVPFLRVAHALGVEPRALFKPTKLKPAKKGRPAAR